MGEQNTASYHLLLIQRDIRCPSVTVLASVVPKEKFWLTPLPTCLPKFSGKILTQFSFTNKIYHLIVFDISYFILCKSINYPVRIACF